MAMGIVSDEEFEKEAERLGDKPPTTFPSLSDETNEAAKIIEQNRGRGVGNVEVPDSLRKIIGETAVTDGRQEAVNLAKQFGISPQSASAYANGATSLSTYDRQPNLEHINQAKERVNKKARSRLMLALKTITKDKLEGTTVRDAAGIAKDMSVIMKNTEPVVKDVNDKQNNQFIIYAPQFRDERSFEVVHAKE